MIRVAVVDDQPLITSAFAALIDDEPDMAVVGTGGSGVDAVELAGREQPDVLLLDVRMPKMDGLEAARRIAADGDRPRVLVLTTFNVDDYVLAAVEAGAAGYLLKDTRAEELIAAIRTVHDGKAVIAADATPHLIDAYRRSREAETGAPTINPASARLLKALTSRELEVFAQVAIGKSNPEIAEELHLAETTVKTHIGHLLAKLHCRDRVALVVLAHAAGLVH